MGEVRDITRAVRELKADQRRLLDQLAELHVWLEEHLGAVLDTPFDVLVLDPSDAF